MQNSILVPIDFSHIAPTVLENTRSFASAFDAKVWLLHVAQTRVDILGMPFFTRDSVARTLRGSHQDVSHYAENLRSVGIDATPLVVRGKPAQKILSKARELEANMIILGTHGHGTTHHFLTHDTSEVVLKHAPCPVVVISSKNSTNGHDRELDTFRLKEIYPTNTAEAVKNSRRASWYEIDPSLIDI
jgi:nucleotide-binding universal stress UspA family protein